MRSYYVRIVPPAQLRKGLPYYRLGAANPHAVVAHRECCGLPVAIENLPGTERYWYDPHTATSGTTVMRYAYGFIEGTKGMDGEEVDVYLGPHFDVPLAFVVHQVRKPKTVGGAWDQPDEDKVMLGFLDQDEAVRAYMAHYDDPRFMGGVTPVSVGKLLDYLRGRR